MERKAKKIAKKDSLATIGTKRKMAAKAKSASSAESTSQEGSAESASPPCISVSSSSASSSVFSPERKKKKQAPAVPTSPAAYHEWLMTANPFFLSAKQKEERSRNVQKDRAQRSLKAEIAQRRKETSALFGCNTPEGARANGINGKNGGVKKGGKKIGHAVPYQQKKKSVAAIFNRGAGGAGGDGGAGGGAGGGSGAGGGGGGAGGAGGKGSGWILGATSHAQSMETPSSAIT